MREPFVHDAVVTMAAGGDTRAPGGATTRWQLRSAQPGLLRDDEARHAQQLIRLLNVAVLFGRLLSSNGRDR